MTETLAGSSQLLNLPKVCRHGGRRTHFDAGVKAILPTGALRLGLSCPSRISRELEI